MKSGILSLVALVTVLAGSVRAQVPFDECGNMIQGVTCPLLFEDTQGRKWLLDNNGGFGVGAQVRVQGLADPFCITICQQGNGCVAVSQIGPCGTTPGVGYCFGDGAGTPCPCGNNSPAGQGRGCLNSLGSGGLLGATGTASVANDTLVLQGSGMPDASALYFQGTTQLAGGTGVLFGDGLRCAGGAVVRLGLKTNASGSSQYPGTGDPSVSVKGGVVAGDTRNYQVWYRNAAAFCTAATFNLTNGFQVVWSS